MNYSYLLFFSFFSFHIATAQNTQLFENEWYLQKVVIDDEEILPPFPSTVGRVFFSDTTFEVLHTFCEEGFGVGITYDGDTGFDIENGGNVLLGTCTQPEVIEFGQAHFLIYHNQGTAKNPFEYTFETEEDLLILTVTNNEGDQVVYANALLSTETNLLSTIRLVPNPTASFVRLEGLDDVIFKNGTVFSSLGKKLMTSTNKKIDLTSYPSGLYFVLIETNDDTRVFKKILKE